MLLTFVLLSVFFYGAIAMLPAAIEMNNEMADFMVDFWL